MISLILLGFGYFKIWGIFSAFSNVLWDVDSKWLVLDFNLTKLSHLSRK